MPCNEAVQRVWSIARRLRRILGHSDLLRDVRFTPAAHLRDDSMRWDNEVRKYGHRFRSAGGTCGNTSNPSQPVDNAVLCMYVVIRFKHELAGLHSDPTL